MKKAYLLTTIFMTSCALYAMDQDVITLYTPPIRIYKEEEVAVQNEVFDAASEQAQQLVAHLKDRNALGTPEMNGVLLVGRPGTGKTEFTKAVARKAGRWALEEIHPQEVCGEDRFETDINLKHRLDDISLGANNKTLIVCDKMDEMFPKYFERRDTLERRAKKEQKRDFLDWFAELIFESMPQEKIKRYEPQNPQFCKWFDEVPPHKELFFIGIAQDSESLPHAFKYTMSNKTYHFSDHPDKKATALLWHLASCKSMDGSVNKELLRDAFSLYENKWEMLEAGGFNGHDMKALADGAKQYASQTPSGILTAEAVKSSFGNLYAERQRNGYYKDE